MRRKALVCLSGGLDSTTVLGLALSPPYIRDCTAVFFDYGSKHNSMEAEAAQNVAKHYKIPIHGAVDLKPISRYLKSDLLQSGGAIPEGHYEAESMKQTVVPGRNMIFIAVLTGMAQSMEAKEIWMGMHSGDHYIYPDCRPGFVLAMEEAIAQATEGKVHLKVPFLEHKKSELLRVGLDIGVPYHLTRTCYQNTRTACGRCGSCQERLEAFALNGKVDPLEYDSRELMPKK